MFVAAVCAGACAALWAALFGAVASVVVVDVWVPFRELAGDVVEFFGD